MERPQHSLDDVDVELSPSQLEAIHQRVQAQVEKIFSDVA